MKVSKIQLKELAYFTNNPICFTELKIALFVESLQMPSFVCWTILRYFRSLSEKQLGYFVGKHPVRILRKLLLTKFLEYMHGAIKYI